MYIYIYVYVCVCVFVVDMQSVLWISTVCAYLFVWFISLSIYDFTNTIQYTVYRCRHDIFSEPERKKHKINNRHQLAILASSSFNYAVCHTYQSAPRDLCRRLSRKHFATTSIRHDPSLHCGNLALKISSNAEKNIQKKKSQEKIHKVFVSAQYFWTSRVAVHEPGAWIKRPPAPPTQNLLSGLLAHRFQQGHLVLPLKNWLMNCSCYFFPTKKLQGVIDF